MGGEDIEVWDGKTGVREEPITAGGIRATVIEITMCRAIDKAAATKRKIRRKKEGRREREPGKEQLDPQKLALRTL